MLGKRAETSAFGTIIRFSDRQGGGGGEKVREREREREERERER